METNNKEFVKSQNCERVIAKLTETSMESSADDCYKIGNLHVPNMGWLFNQGCANEFEKKYEIKFERTRDGKVDYYAP